MAGVLSKTLIFHTKFLLRHSLKPPPTTLLSFRRHSSFKPQLIEIDLDSSSSASSPSPSSPASESNGSAEHEAAAINKLEAMVRRIIVHKSTPDWLPFIPGSSFWVPPPHGGTGKIADLVDRLTNQLTEEESLSVTSLRGWPCSSFFIPPDDSTSTQQEDVGLEFEVAENEVVEVKVELLSYAETSLKPEDEEN